MTFLSTQSTLKKIKITYINSLNIFHWDPHQAIHYQTPTPFPPLSPPHVPCLLDQTSQFCPPAKPPPPAWIIHGHLFTQSATTLPSVLEAVVVNAWLTRKVMVPRNVNGFLAPSSWTPSSSMTSSASLSGHPLDGVSWGWGGTVRFQQLCSWWVVVFFLCSHLVLQVGITLCLSLVTCLYLINILK